MISTGLASVTFRSRPVDDVVDLAVGAGLEVVEWAADVRVRPGDTATATRLAGLCGERTGQVVR